MGDALRSAVFWIGLAAFAAVLVWVALTGGDEVPAQADAAGRVARRESTPIFVLTMAALGVLLLVVTRGARALVRRVEGQWITMPSPAAQAYWSRAENRPELARRIGADLDLVFGGALLLLAGSTWSLVASGPPTTMATLVFAGLAVGYCLWMSFGARYRPPAS